MNVQCQTEAVGVCCTRTREHDCAHCECVTPISLVIILDDVRMVLVSYPSLLPSVFCLA